MSTFQFCFGGDNFQFNWLYGKCVGEKLINKMDQIGDVTFLVGPEGEAEEVKSLVALLRTLSTVFDTMFDDNWKSQNEIIKLPDIKPKEFRHFLKLVVVHDFKRCESTISDLSMEETLHLLYIANKYNVESIQFVCRLSIKKKLEISNAVLAYQTLQTLNEPELEEFLLAFIEKNVDRILDDESFKDLSQQSLRDILKCQKLPVSELFLLEAVCRWAEFQCSERELEASGENMRTVLGDVLYLIRFPLMSHENLFSIVEPLGILIPEEILSISRSIALKSQGSDESPFSSEKRDGGEGKEGKKEETNPQVNPQELFFAFIPSERVEIKSIQFPQLRRKTKGLDSNYEMSVRISQGSRDILPKFTKKIEGLGSTSSLCSIQLTKPVILEPQHSYKFHYEFKSNGNVILPMEKGENGNWNINFSIKGTSINQ